MFSGNKNKRETKNNRRTYVHFSWPVHHRATPTSRTERVAVALIKKVRAHGSFLRSFQCGGQSSTSLLKR